MPKHRAPGRVVSLDEMVQLADTLRERGRTIVFTNGCFDLLHHGHVICLQEAAALGDLLVVGINSDRSVRRLKGNTRPVVGQSGRAAVLAALACVDYVLIFEQPTPNTLLRTIRPHVLVKGGTYTTDEVVGREIVRSYGGRVCVTGKVDDVSTTQIVSAMAAGAHRSSKTAE